MKVLVLGAGYIGGKLGELALGEGHEVTLADNWFATERSQLARLEAGGARVETADIRDRGDLGRLLRDAPDRLYLLAAQASRPVSEQNPDYTEATNVTGVRLVAEAVGAAPVRVPVVFGSSLHVYGPDLRGTVGSEHPYGEQRDLAHLSKVYGELVLRMHAAEAGFDLALLRLGIVYGRSPVEHEAPESQTVVDRFRRLAAARRELPVDDAETALGIVHVDDAARILLSAPDDRGVSAANVAAETVTVGDLARLATGDRPTGSAGCLFTSPFAYEHRVADYLQP